MKKILLLALSLNFLTAKDTFSKFIEDDSWGKHYVIPEILTFTTVAMAAIEGNDTRLGRTAWHSLDSLILSAGITAGLKNVFGRVRPKSRDQYGGKDVWFESGNKSFPSGHVTAAAAVVTPFILEYGEEYPLMHLLWAIPIHQMFGRYEDKAHDVEDVAAGFAVGAFTGWAVRKYLDTPLFLTFTKDGIYTGINFKF